MNGINETYSSQEHEGHDTTNMNDEIYAEPAAAKEALACPKVVLLPPLL